MAKFTPPQATSNVHHRKSYIDALNVMACISVVLMHHNRFWIYEDSLQWNLSVIIETICYWAVPVFFMLSGATLINYEERYSTRFFFRKRFLRTLVPYLFFSVLAYLGYYVPKFGPVSLGEFILGMTKAQFFGVYWFFIPLFWLYLLMPFLTKFRTLSEKSQFFIIAVLFLLNSLRFASRISSFFYEYADNMIVGPVLYCLLGFFLATNDINKNLRYVVYVFGILSFLLRGIFLFILSHQDGDVNVVLTDYYYPTTVSMATMIFMAIQYIRIPKEIANKLKILSSLSLGIYLLHFFIILLERQLISHDINENFFRAILMSFICYAICATIVYLCKKIPYIKLLFP